MMRLIIRTHKSCRWCLIKETIVNRGTPNGRIFANMPEVSQMVFTMRQKPVWLIWSCPENYLSVRMSQGNFGRHESFRCLYRLIRKCQLPLCRKSEYMKQPCFHQKIIGDILSLYRMFQETFFNNILVLIVVKLLENLPIFQTNGTLIQKFVAFLKLQNFLDSICSFEQLFYRKKSLGALV